MQSASKFETSFPREISVPLAAKSLRRTQVLVTFTFASVGAFLLVMAYLLRSEWWLQVLFLAIGGTTMWAAVYEYKAKNRLIEILSQVKGRELVIEEDRLRVATPLLTGALKLGPNNLETPLYSEVFWSQVYDVQLQSGGKNSPPMVLIQLNTTPKMSCAINRTHIKEVEEQLMAAINERVAALTADGRRVAPAPEQLKADAQRRRMFIAMQGAIFAAVVVHGLISAIRPFAQGLSAPAAILLFSVPAGLSLTFVLGLYDKNKISTLFAPAGLLLILLLDMILIFGNVLLDPSPPQQFELPLVSKDWSKHKSSTTYYAYFTPPLTAKFPVNLHEDSRVTVSHELYSQLVPGMSKVAVTAHAGAFGLPYYSTWTVSANHVLASPAPLPKAPDWQPEPFDYGRPERHFEERWPNGQLRTKEPIVNGQKHGLGEYWWQDGKEYSKIQWKNGKKHGTYKTHRPDGSIEGEFTFKDDRMHGVQRWFTPEGKLQQEEVYIEGRHIQR